MAVPIQKPKPKSRKVTKLIPKRKSPRRKTKTGEIAFQARRGPFKLPKNTILILAIPLVLTTISVWQLVHSLFVYVFSFIAFPAISIASSSLTILLFLGIKPASTWLTKKFPPERLVGKTEPIYGGFWRRCGAILIDSLLVFLPMVCMWYLAPSWLASTWILWAQSAALLGLRLAMLKRWGQTPGKWVMGLKVLRTDLSALGWREVLLRNLLELVTLATPFIVFPLRELLAKNGPEQLGYLALPIFLLGTGSILSQIIVGAWGISEPIVLLSNRKKRALHDYVAGTVVVVLKKNEQLSKGAYLTLRWRRSSSVSF